MYRSFIVDRRKIESRPSRARPRSQLLPTRSKRVWAKKVVKALAHPAPLRAVKKEDKDLVSSRLQSAAKNIIRSVLLKRKGKAITRVKRKEKKRLLPNSCSNYLIRHFFFSPQVSSNFFSLSLCCCCCCWCDYKKNMPRIVCYFIKIFQEFYHIPSILVAPFSAHSARSTDRRFEILMVKQLTPANTNAKRQFLRDFITISVGR